jgi:hypothetical protein
MQAPVIDTGGLIFLGLLALGLGAIVTLLCLLITSFIESLILKKLGWGSGKYCFRLSTLANTLSLVTGVILSSFVSDIVPNALSTSHDKWMVLLFLLSTFVCTYLIESITLYVFGRKKHSVKSILLAALYTNLVSYGLLLLILLVAF